MKKTRTRRVRKQKVTLRQKIANYAWQWNNDKSIVLYLVCVLIDGILASMSRKGRFLKRLTKRVIDFSIGIGIMYGVNQFFEYLKPFNTISKEGMFTIIVLMVVMLAQVFTLIIFEKKISRVVGYVNSRFEDINVDYDEEVE